VRMDEYYIPADACANPMHGFNRGTTEQIARWPFTSNPKTGCCIFHGSCFTRYYLFAVRNRTPRVR